MNRRGNRQRRDLIGSERVELKKNNEWVGKQSCVFLLFTSPLLLFILPILSPFLNFYFCFLIIFNCCLVLVNFFPTNSFTWKHVRCGRTPAIVSALEKIPFSINSILQTSRNISNSSLHTKNEYCEIDDGVMIRHTVWYDALRRRGLSVFCVPSHLRMRSDNRSVSLFSSLLFSLLFLFSSLVFSSLLFLFSSLLFSSLLFSSLLFYSLLFLRSI